MLQTKISMDFRIGLGSDIHRLVENRPLIIGNIIIPHYKGCDGHSDGDALIHAICDALLGAVNQRDIGFHFPDTSSDNKDKDSSYFLKRVMEIMEKEGYQVGNIDTIISLQKPKLSGYIPQMQKRISELMNLDITQISIKAKTGERLGFVGQEEGIKVEAIALVKKK